mmetsp:Transcript_12327/g.24025  ORF Transcript_12327/g.24025 Transcript_12327/m.24025 type:complete len:101 (+) Transcript_12327:262-564(+)
MISVEGGCADDGVVAEIVTIAITIMIATLVDFITIPMRMALTATTVVDKISVAMIGIMMSTILILTATKAERECGKCGKISGGIGQRHAIWMPILGEAML